MQNATMTPEQYCQDKAAASGSSFYYSFRFLPSRERQAITALYAFCREVDDAVDNCSEPALAHTKLEWWRKELDCLYQGNPQHPVTRSLKNSMQHFHLPREYLEEIVDGMQMDLEISRYPTFKELSLYCYRVAGVVGILSADIFGYRNRKTLNFAQLLGTALQLTNIIRDVREDASRGRIYIPLDELQRFSVKESDFSLPKTTDAMQNLLAYQAQRAHEYFQRALETLPREDRYSQRSALIMAKIYQSLLVEIEEDGFQVLEHRIQLTPLHKLWLAWKTARKEKRLSRHLTPAA